MCIVVTWNILTFLVRLPHHPDPHPFQFLCSSSVKYFEVLSWHKPEGQRMQEMSRCVSWQGFHYLIWCGFIFIPSLYTYQTQNNGHKRDVDVRQYTKLYGTIVTRTFDWMYLKAFVYNSIILFGFHLADHVHVHYIHLNWKVSLLKNSEIYLKVYV